MTDENIARTSKQRCIVIPLDVNQERPLEELLRRHSVTFWVRDFAVVREPIYRLADETAAATPTP